MNMEDNNNFKINSIDPSRLIIDERSRGLIDSITCKQCSFILNDPFDCRSCEETSCSSCLKKETINGENKFQCPKCTNSNLITSIFANQLLSSRKFNCLRGCENEIPYNDYLNHVNSCIGKLEKCPICDSLVEKLKIDQRSKNFKEGNVFQNKDKEEQFIILENKLKEQEISHATKQKELTDKTDELKNDIRIKTNQNNRLKKLISLGQEKIQEIIKNKEESDINFIKDLRNNINSFLNVEFQIKKRSAVNEISNQNSNIQKQIPNNELNQLNDSINFIGQIEHRDMEIRKLKSTINSMQKKKEAQKQIQSNYKTTYYKKFLNKHEIKMNYRHKLEIYIKEFSEALKQNNIVNILNLDRCKLGSHELEILSEAIIVNNNITELNLGDNNINEVGTGLIGKIIKFNKSITKLLVYQNKLCGEGFKIMMEGIQINKSLIHLNLNSNNIRDHGVEYIFEGLKSNSSIKEIGLGCNNITNLGANYISKSIRLNTTLQTLSLIKNDINDEGAIMILDGIKVNNTITKLDLNGNELTASCFDHINNYFTKN